MVYERNEVVLKSYKQTTPCGHGDLFVYKVHIPLDAEHELEKHENGVKNTLS